MKKEFVSLSEKMMVRKKKRKNRIILTILFSIWGTGLVGFVGYRAWHEHKRNLPNWAEINFTTQAEYSDRITFNSNTHEVPFKATINGETWDFIQVDHFSDSSIHKPGSIEAETNCIDKTITYLPSDDKPELRINILHELFHAGACLHGGDTWWNNINPTASYHPGIERSAEFMHTFLHDNKQFAVWLGEE